MRKTFARKLTVKEAIEILEHPDDYYMFDRIEAIGISYTVYKSYMNQSRMICLENFQKISDAFRLSVDYITGKSDEKGIAGNE